MQKEDDEDREGTIGTLQAAFEAFHKHDVDEDHLISSAELLNVLKEAGLKVGLEEVKEIIGLADMEGDGYLDFEEFYSIFVGLEIFQTLEKDTKHAIKKEDLKRTLRRYGLDTNEEKLNRMLRLVGADEEVGFDDFLRIYIKAHHQHHKNIDFLEHAVRHWYSGAAKDTLLTHSQNLTPMQDFVAGTVAGVAITLVGHPFDTIKVRVQTASGSAFNSAIDATMKTLKGEGIRGLYKGMASPMATIPIINAIVFAAYGQAKGWFTDPENPNKPLTLFQLALAGGWAGLVNSVVVSPVELIKTRLQIQYESPDSLQNIMRNFWRLESGSLGFTSAKGGTRGNSAESFRGPIDAIRKIQQKAGTLGLMRGMSATVYREVPAYMGQFVVYELLKRYMITLEEKEGGSSDDLHPVQLMLAGGLAGISAWVVSYPMDFVKSQIQAAPDFLEKSSTRGFKPNPYLLDGGFFDCMMKNVRNGGWMSLWKGFAPCVARAFPANAAGFLVYEFCSKMIRSEQKKNSSKDQ